MEEIRVRISLSIKELCKQVEIGELDIFKSFETMDKLVKSSLSELQVSLKNQISPNSYCFVVFGSPARKAMLPNSDLDIAVVFVEDVSQKQRKIVFNAIGTLPFDKIDILDWNYNLEFDSSRNMLDISKSFDTKCVAGNNKIFAKYYNQLNPDQKHIEQGHILIGNHFIFHKWNYLSKYSPEAGENLKYSFGSARDTIFLDWYANFNQAPETEKPRFQDGLDVCLKNKLIDNFEEYSQILWAIKLLYLIKTMALDLSHQLKNNEVLTLNSKNVVIYWEKSKKALQKLDIGSLLEFEEKYYQARKLLWNLVEKIVTDVEIKLPPDTNQWRQDVKLAILEETSQEKLVKIMSKNLQNTEYQYIFRIISTRKNLSEEIKELLKISILEEKYKIKL